MPQDILRLHGEQVIPLSKVVKELCLKQGNMKETNVFQQLVYGRWAWKELFRRTMWGINNAVVNVDCKTHTIKIPDDCERMINISVVDCSGHLQPLTCDPGLNTVEITCCAPKCSCQKCNGTTTLCASIDTVTYTTEEVVIKGQTYTQQTWIRYDNGAVQQQQKIPVLNAATDEVEFTTIVNTLCNVETTEEGCIKNTPSNQELLRQNCGCGNFPEQSVGIYPYWRHSRDSLIPQPYNFYGYWNTNAANPGIIHIYRYDTTRRVVPATNNILLDNMFDKVIVSYQANGERPGDEILIPEYAQMAVQLGIMWQQKQFNPRTGAGDKEYAKNEWRAECMKVNKHLNPIKMEDIAKLQTQIRRW